MTNEELKKYKRPLPMAFTMLPIDFIYEHIEDEHGVTRRVCSPTKERTSS